jgi:hypothetical protein
MKATVLIEKEVDLKILSVRAHARYWEDGTVNGEPDVEGKIPCRDGECWCPEIDIETGKILNWQQGVTTSIHYKVCDSGSYKVKDSDGNTIFDIEDYVPATMCPKESGFGDYIIMDIDENGMIQNWEFKVEHFSQED